MITFKTISLFTYSSEFPLKSPLNGSGPLLKCVLFLPSHSRFTLKESQFTLKETQ